MLNVTTHTPDVEIANEDGIVDKANDSIIGTQLVYPISNWNMIAKH